MAAFIQLNPAGSRYFRWHPESNRRGLRAIRRTKAKMSGRRVAEIPQSQYSESRSGPLYQLNSCQN